MPITYLDLLHARRRLAGQVVRTNVVESPTLSAHCGVPVLLKLEHRQVTGSFKLRGATNAVLALDAAARARGIVGVSTGNHGRGLAHAAKQAGARCIICMSKLVPQNKIAGIKALGAEVRIVGTSQDEAQHEVDRLVEHEGMTMLPPFDHPHIIAGQGTLGLEVIEDVPEVATVLVPLSGGGLLAGTALAVKTANPAAHVIGVSMARGAAMHTSQQAGRPVQVEELPTLADSLGGGIGLANAHTFAMVRDLTDGLILVDEDAIAEAIRHAYQAEYEVIEGSGAVGIAALLTGKVKPRGAAVVVVSGRNIAIDLHRRIVNGDNPKL